MKVKKVLAPLILALSFAANAATYQLSFWSPFDVPSDFVFDHIRIGATTDGTYSPWNDDDLYVGFSGAENYVRLTAIQEIRGDYDPDTELTLYATGVDMDIGNMQGYSFFVELLSGTSVIGYSGYSDYATVLLSDPSNKKFTEWTPSNFSTAVPEPSSGLLLLIGGALVGLRRKRRAA